MADAQHVIQRWGDYERMSELTWKEWVLDVTFDPPVFVPYERETGAVVIGMNVLSDKCPGKLVGVIHADGQEAVEKWISENPDWHERYRVANTVRE